MSDNVVEIVVKSKDQTKSGFASVKRASLGVVGGLALIGGKAVQLEAEFGKTMNVLGATLGAPKAEMKSLSDLAMKMGADTVFSAGDASKAMLELARGGMSAATIKAGALQGTLTLAAAGELEMGEAANIAVKAMGQFNLGGKDMASVAAALAGGANASSASVRDMSQALAMGGLAANSVGFSLQETTAVLAAFSNAGLEGSDAGTSLKTMLDRLQPATAKQAGAMAELGVMTEDGRNRFIKANGEFKSAAQVAEILKQGTEKLSDAERKRLISQAFGSDAQRAATIFAEEGAGGLKKLLKATSDQDAAQKTAAANMKGTGGALEKMSGAIETAGLKFGQVLAPVVVKAADGLGKLATVAAENQTTTMALAGVLGGLAVTVLLVNAGMKAYAAGVAVVSAATKAYAAVQWLLNAAMSANPIGLIVLALAALAATIVIAWKKSDTFKSGLLSLGIVGVKSFKFLLQAATFSFFGILKAAAVGLGWIPGIGGKIKKAVKAFEDFKDKTVAALDKTAEKLQRMKDKIDGIKSPKPVKITVETGAALGALIGLQKKINKMRGKTVPIWIDLLTTNKGPKTNTDLYGVPGSAHGGIASGWREVGERGRELVKLPGGSHVYPNNATEAMLSGGGSSSSGQPIVIQLVLDSKVVWEGQKRLYRNSRGAMGVA